MSVMYADIIVDISAGNLDRVFQYKIPKHLLSEVDIGVQVLIPFGKGNRTTKGFVVNLTTSPDYDVEKIKEITCVINDELAVEAQLIRLAWQMKKVYGGTMSQALRTVVPVKKQVKAVVQQFYRLSSEEKDLEHYLESIRGDRRYRARVSLLEALKNPRYAGEDGIPVLSREDILTHLKISMSTVNALVEAGYVETVQKIKYRSPWRSLMPKKAAVNLNEDQRAVVQAIMEDDSHRIHLLHGVTGSGKTEVYMELISRVIQRGQQAIVLIPEISLSLQTVSRFHARFGDRVSVMNSRLSDGEKYDQYLRAKRGEIDIVVGPRSALFMPFENLGMIVIDEEHDGAYKSENTPKFHARDVAAWRAEMTGAKVVLGSATPAMGSYARALTDLYGFHELKGRAREGSVLPQVTVVDLREEFKLKNKKIFSRKLHDMIEECLARHEQVILFLNRRGYAGFVSCRSCGHVFTCRHCQVSMTAHNNGWLKCHYCGYEERIPKICPECGSPYVAAFGTGTQKVEQMVMDEFPGARVLRLDRDSTAKKNSMDEILERFGRHEADILVGTQMIVKGHDFPGVTLVGILAADLSMFSNDYMAAERTFDLLTQAAGRAGRADRPGQVVIQTYNPEHYSIVCAGRQDYAGFFRQEMAYRRALSYPPVSHMMVVLAVSPVEAAAWEYIQKLLEAGKTYCSDEGFGDIHFIGPSSASLSKGKDIYRKVFYVKSRRFDRMISLREFMEGHHRASAYKKDVGLLFDVNPMSVY